MAHLQIQQVVSRSGGRPLLEQRQMKICATCFEISICLFRVVEMAVTIAPSLFTDTSNPSADLLLHRLIQVRSYMVSKLKFIQMIIRHKGLNLRHEHVLITVNIFSIKRK